MARLTRSGPVELEPLAPAIAEEWFGLDDVQAAQAAGHAGRALLDHLAVVAGERYRTAARDRRPASSAIERGDVLTTRRPAPGPPCEEVTAWRSWIFTGRALWRDPEAFLAVV